MASFNKWKETPYSLEPGLNTINLDPGTNVVKIINEDMLGSVLFLSTKSDVSSTRFEEKSEKGSSTSLVRTRPLNAAYIYNPAGSRVSITLIEIETDDISFIFNATNQVQISGQLTSDGIKATDLKLMADKTQYVNDVDARAKLDSLINLMTINNTLLRDLITGKTTPSA
jgi:hypothetical protein